MIARIVVVVIVAAVSVVALRQLESATEGGSGLDEQGRLEFPIHADWIPVDAQGRPASGPGGGYDGVCEADAEVVIEGGEIKSVEDQGGKVVRVGEEVADVDTEYEGLVYHDSEGVLHTGCTPESWDSYKPAPSEP